MKAEELLAVAGGAVVKLSGLDGRKEEVQANAELQVPLSRLVAVF